MGSISPILVENFCSICCISKASRGKVETFFRVGDLVDFWVGEEPFKKGKYRTGGAEGRKWPPFGSATRRPSLSPRMPFGTVGTRFVVDPGSTRDVYIVGETGD